MAVFSQNCNTNFSSEGNLLLLSKIFLSIPFSHSFWGCYRKYNLPIWLVVVVSLRFHKKNVKRWTARLQWYFEERKYLWQKSIKKKTQNILCVTWYLCRGKKEGKKEAAYLKRMWQRLLGCSSFRTFTWFRDNFWEYKSSQTICNSDVSKESGYMV